MKIDKLNAHGHKAHICSHLGQMLGIDPADLAASSNIDTDGPTELFTLNLDGRELKIAILATPHALPTHLCVSQDYPQVLGAIGARFFAVFSNNTMLRGVLASPQTDWSGRWTAVYNEYGKVQHICKLQEGGKPLLMDKDILSGIRSILNLD